jgi:hypothetical protein
MQENETFSKHPAPSVLDWPPKLMWRFTINLWRYCGPWCHEFCQQSCLTTLWTSSSVTNECHPWAPSSGTSVCPSLNFLHHSLTQLSLITLSPYTWHNRRWISAALCPSAWRKRSQHVPQAGRSGVDSVHVSSAITPTLRNENAQGLVFRENKLCL